jgi:uncharacterized delta-60 repeat protein
MQLSRILTLTAPCAAALASPAPATAASGDVDRSFGGGVASRVVSTFRASQGQAFDVVRAARARVAVGNLYTCDRSGDEECGLPAHGVLVAFTGDGRRSVGFGGRGVAALPRRLGEISAVATSPRGGIVLAGDGEIGRAGRIAVYTSSGRPDRGFGVGGQATVPSAVDALNDLGGVAVDADRRVAVIGSSCDYADPPGSDSTHTSIAVFSADGRLEPGFGSGGVARLEGDLACGDNRVAFQRDGRLLIAGTHGGPGDRVTVARLNRDGSLDRAFGVDGVADAVRGRVKALAVAGNGSFAVAGSTLGDQSGQTLARWRSDGRLDSRFGRGGVIAQRGRPFNDVAIDSRGRVLADAPRGLQRFSAGGRRDTAFERRATRSLTMLSRARRFVWNSEYNGLSIDDDGRVYLSGTRNRRAVPTTFALAALRY